MVLLRTERRRTNQKKKKQEPNASGTLLIKRIKYKFQMEEHVPPEKRMNLHMLPDFCWFSLLFIKEPNALVQEFLEFSACKSLTFNSLYLISPLSSSFFFSLLGVSRPPPVS
jgi:hypothetical protein